MMARPKPANAEIPFGRLLIQLPKLQKGKVVFLGDWCEFGSRQPRDRPLGLLPLEHDLDGTLPVPPSVLPADVKLWFDFLLGGGYPDWHVGALELIDYQLLGSDRHRDAMYIGRQLRMFRGGTMVPVMPPIERPDYSAVVRAGLHFASVACGDIIPVEPVDIPRPCGPDEARHRLQRLRCSVTAAVAAQRTPADPFADLRELAKELKLIKNELAIISVLCDKGGSLPIEALSADLPDPWPDPAGNWNSARKRLNRKLESHGVTLVTRNGRATIDRHPPQNGRN